MPSESPNSQFVIQTDTISNHFQRMQAITPAIVKSIIQMADDFGEVGPLYDLYDRMDRTDARYGGLKKQLANAVTGMPLKFTPAKTSNAKDRSVAQDYMQVMQEVVCRDLDAHDLVRGFIEPYFSGYQLFQLKWRLVDMPYGRKMWFPSQLRKVPHDVLKVDVQKDSKTIGEMLVRTDTHPNGLPVSEAPHGSILECQSEYAWSQYSKIGTARQCLPWYIGVQFVQGWWLQHIEQYGAPMRIGRHPRGINDKDRDRMETFLKMLGRHGYALFPNDMEVQLIEANNQGNITTHTDFINKAHQEYAITILGQATTVGDEGKGSYANGVISNSIRFEVMKEAGVLVRKGFDTLADMVLTINYGDVYESRLRPIIQPLVQAMGEMTAKATTFSTLTQAGVPIPSSWPYEHILGVEAPVDGEEAILHGQTYIVGQEPIPEPVAPNVNENGTNSDTERPASGSRSVANGSEGND